MPTYQAFGLAIHSSLTFPELPSADRPPDVEISIGSPTPRPLTTVSDGCLASVIPGDAYIYWPDIALFRILGGYSVIISPSLGVKESVLRLYILGPVLAILLHQRGHLVLHASSVAIDGSAVAFAARSGGGKSTVAAAISARGYPLLADDITAVRSTDLPLIVSPGFPRLKLWPDSATALGWDTEAMPRVHPDFNKHDYAVKNSFHCAPLPLKQVYLVSEGPKQEIEHISRQEALIELIRHTYRVRLLHHVWPSSHVEDYARLVNTVPVCRLTYPRDLALLPDLARMVEEDALRH